MLNLFARLRKLSTKLSPTSADRPREPRQPVTDARDGAIAPPEQQRPAAIESRRRRIRGGNSSTDISTNLYPSNADNSHLPTSTASLAGNAAISGDLRDEAQTEPAATKKSSKATKVKSPFLTVVGTTATAVGTTAGWLGTNLAKPFRGPKPLHKNRWFWAGSTLGLGALALTGAWIFVDRSVSQYAPAEALSYVRPGTITIKGLNGSILLQTGNATRETLKVWQMPLKLRQAFVAIEDRRFYEHDGVDYKGVTRALVQNVTSKNLVEGASSINQQLARMVYLNQERSFWRKLREVRLAQKLTEGLSKDQILERYLNLVYLGEGTYGVADSAWVYFSKTVDQLTLAEMATLAAMPPAPNKYSPFVNPRFAQQRRNLVLDRMVDAKFLTIAEAKTAKAEPLTPKRSPTQTRRTRSAVFHQIYRTRTASADLCQSDRARWLDRSKPPSIPSGKPKQKKSSTPPSATIAVPSDKPRW